MTDNEKRAHDIAIASIPMLTRDRSILEALGGKFDIYKSYLLMYDETLKSINRDFPTNEQ